MNVRTLLIIGGLALPIIAFAILSQSVPESTSTSAQVNTPHKDGPQTAPQTADNYPDAGSVPANVNPGPESAPPVVLPPLSRNDSAANAQPDPNAANPNAQAAAGGTVQAPDPAATMTLQESINKLKTRLGELEKLTPAQRPAERQRHPGAPATLAQAKEYNRNRLAKLSVMTEEDFQKMQQALNERRRQQWQQMSPQQQLNAASDQQHKAKPMLPALNPAANQ